MERTVTQPKSEHTNQEDAESSRRGGPRSASINRDAGWPPHPTVFGDAIDMAASIAAIMQAIKELRELVETRLDVLGARKAYYTVEQFAAMVGRRPFTVRQWANLKRIHAEKSQSRCGAFTTWTIAHEEYLRFQREGLLPRREDER